LFDFQDIVQCVFKRRKN